MAVFVTDPAIQEQLLAARAASGADRYDEVWDGVHMMAPMPNDEHQLLVSRIGYILEDIVGLPGLGQVRPFPNPHVLGRALTDPLQGGPEHIPGVDP